MFKKADHDIVAEVTLKSGRRVLRRSLKSGWDFEIEGRAFFLYRFFDEWQVSDIPTGLSLGARGITRGEAVALFERSYYDAYLRTIAQERYQELVDEFDRMPRKAA